MENALENISDIWSDTTYKVTNVEKRLVLDLSSEDDHEGTSYQKTTSSSSENPDYSHRIFWSWKLKSEGKESESCVPVTALLMNLSGCLKLTQSVTDGPSRIKSMGILSV